MKLKATTIEGLYGDPVTSAARDSNNKIIGSYYEVRETFHQVIHIVTPRDLDEFDIQTKYTHGRLEKLHGTLKGIHYRLTITVKPGYHYDGASIPYIGRMIITPMNPFIQRAALIHDVLYGLRIYRHLADLVFKNIMLEDGMNKVRVTLCSFTVETFGWYPYKKDTRGDLS